MRRGGADRSSATEALAACDEWRPDILIADIGMPGEDGYTLMKKLRAREELRGGHIPAIALTAYARQEDRLRALSVGYEHHVPKPIEPDELLAVVASLANRTGKDENSRKNRTQHNAKAGLYPGFRVGLWFSDTRREMRFKAGCNQPIDLKWGQSLCECQRFQDATFRADSLVL